MKVLVCRQWKESKVRESVMRLLERCAECGVTYMPRNGEVCKCEEPKVEDWDGIGWRPELELQDDEQT